MAAKSEEHNIKVTGPGLSFDRPISQDVANQIISLVMTGAVTGVAPAGTPVFQRETPAAGLPTPGGDALTAKQFLAQKRHDNMYERVACLAYYLTHYRNTPQFKTRDISKIATEAATKLSNAARDVNDATSKYNYLVSAGGGRKQITPLGEAVVEALPDREQVKAAIETHRPKRRKRRKAKR